VPDSVAEFFDSLPSRVDPARTAGMTATYGFEIDPAGSWTVSVRDGQVAVAEGNQGADVTIRAKEDVFLRMLRGEQNPMTAYMLGKIKVEGDTALALKLQKLF
jgi:putative sterol carrier protein